MGPPASNSGLEAGQHVPGEGMCRGGQAGQASGPSRGKVFEAVSLAAFATKQSGGGAKAKSAGHGALGSLRLGEPDDAYEREADRVADEVMSGGALQHHWSLSSMEVNA